MGRVAKESQRLPLRLQGLSLSGIAEPPGATIASRPKWLSGFGFISDGWLGSTSSPLGDLANTLECRRSPSLRLVILGIAVSLGTTHAHIRHLLYGTVVELKHISLPPFSVIILDNNNNYY